MSFQADAFQADAFQMDVVAGYYEPPVLSDPVAGNIGLIGASTILLHLEEPDGVFPSDAAGNLADLNTLAPATMPSSVRSWAGYARRFQLATSTALLAADTATGDTLLVRDVTIQAIVAFYFDPDPGLQTIIQRGSSDGTAAERIAYGLEVEDAGDHIDVSMFWEDSAGTLHTQTAGAYANPGDGEYILLTVTRRWESATRVVVRYYAADQLLAEIISADGDIAGGTTGHTMIGAHRNAGAWTNFLNADLDELRVLDYEMPASEVREIWRRLSVHQPNGVAMLAGLCPPGAGWYDNPGNNIGKLVKLAGEALGLGIAKAEELRALWLPDAATTDIIARWEKICGLTTRPLDSLDVRRARVIAYLSRIRGYSLPAIRQAFSGVLALDESDVGVLELANRIDDPFTTLDPLRWLTGPDAVWAIDTGTLKVTAAIGTDLRWLLTRAHAVVRTSIAAVRTASMFTTSSSYLAQVKLDNFWTSAPVGCLVGLYIANHITRQRIWFGVKNVAGTLKLGYQTYDGTTLSGFTTILTPVAHAPIWIRMRPPRGAFAGDATASVLGYSTTDPLTGFTEVTVNTGVVGAQWAGVAATSDTVLASALEAHFDDFVLLPYNGDRSLHWYVVRDMGLAGTPDMPGAEALAQRIKPAHTEAHVCTGTSVLCDDAVAGLTDRGPLGGI